jgi:hypothetical protein
MTCGACETRAFNDGCKSPQFGKIGAARYYAPFPKEANSTIGHFLIDRNRHLGHINQPMEI